MHAALRTLLLSILLLWGLGSTASAAEFNDSQRKEMEAIIKDYLLANPELLREMGQLLEQKEKLAEDEQRKGALVANADQIFRDGTDFVAGNPNGKVTMVEFFDYNCGWCKKGFPEVLSLIEDGQGPEICDEGIPDIRRRFRLCRPGRDCRQASRANTGTSTWRCSATREKSPRKPSMKSPRRMASTWRSSRKTWRPETAGILERNRNLAQSLAINGTPAFIIDDRLVPGYLPKAELASAINDVRAKGGCSLC